MGFILFHFVMIFKKFHSYNFVTNLLLYLLLILMHSPLAHVNCCVEHDVKDNILIRHSNRIFEQGKDGRLTLIFNHSLDSVYKETNICSVNDLQPRSCKRSETLFKSLLFWLAREVSWLAVEVLSPC